MFVDWKCQHRLQYGLLICVLVTGCGGGRPSVVDVVSVAPIAACAAAATAGLVQRSPYADTDAAPSGGQESGDPPGSYLLFVPEDAPPVLRPLVIGLHGLGGNSKSFADSSGLLATAAELGFIIAFPNRGGRSWDFGRGSADAKFIRDVVTDIRTDEPCVDASRLYVLGHSMGAFMTQRLACEAGDLFAAAVSNAGGTPELLGKCEAGGEMPAPDYESVPLLMWHGDSDGGIKFEAGEQSMFDWRRRYDCDTTPLGGVRSVDFGEISRFSNCRADHIRLPSEESLFGLLTWRPMFDQVHAWADGCGGGGDCDADNMPTHLTAQEMNYETMSFFAQHVREIPAREFPLLLSAAGAESALAATPPVLPDSVGQGNTRVTTRRVDVAGSTIDGQSLSVTPDGMVEVYIAVDVLARASGVMTGSFHPVCPTESGDGPSPQYVAGKPITIRLETDDWFDSQIVETEIFDNPKRSVATAVFTGVPLDARIAVLRASYEGDVSQTFYACGISPVWHKETLPLSFGLTE
jgi:poly(3-hydroxybutyrate) depolymerase